MIIDSGLWDSIQLIDTDELVVVRGTFEIAKTNEFLPIVKLLSRQVLDLTREKRLECGREDSNLHPRKDQDLNLARMPISPRPLDCHPTGRSSVTVAAQQGSSR